jgi:hypothetical protein
MAKRSRSTKPVDLRAIDGAREAPFPGFVPLRHPTLRTKLPEGGDWLYEANSTAIGRSSTGTMAKRSPTRAMAWTGAPNSRRCAWR